MPPRNTPRGFEPHVFLTRQLEEMLRIDPSIDVRPGSPIRTLIESTTHSAESAHEDLERALAASRLETRIDRAHGRDRTGLVIQTLRRINEEQLRGRSTFAVMVDDQARFNAPLTRQDFERAREEIERMDAAAHALSPQDPARGYGAIADLLSPSRVYDQARHVDRARQALMAQEDQEVFRRLDAFANDVNWAANPEPPHDPRLWQQEYMGVPAPIPAEHAPDWHMEELPGRVAVNPRAAARMAGFGMPYTGMPPMPIESEPTVRIDEIQERRYNRHQPSTNQCGEMSLEQMERIARIVRKTAWERLLAVEELEFPAV